MSIDELGQNKYYGLKNLKILRKQTNTVAFANWQMFPAARVSEIVT